MVEVTGVWLRNLDVKGCQPEVLLEINGSWRSVHKGYFGMSCIIEVPSDYSDLQNRWPLDHVTLRPDPKPEEG